MDVSPEAFDPATHSSARAKGEPFFLRFWRFIRPLIVVFAIFTAFRSAIADWNDVPTGSMKPTILEGDRIFVNKLAYDLKIPFTDRALVRWSQPARGDIVVFYSPADHTRLVKRCVAVAGDTVELRQNQLIVNGQPAVYGPLDPRLPRQLPREERGQHDYAAESLLGQKHPMMTTPAIGARRNFGPTVIAEGQFFMMGDNRDNSFDSRYFGPVDRALIVGKAQGVVGSVDFDHHWAPRWDRFLRALP